MLSIKLFFIRKIKGLSLRIGLHKLIEPFSGLLLTLIYLSKLSKWRNEHSNLKFNDFYNSDVKYEDRFKLHDFIYDTEGLSEPIDFYEFGVADGISFKWWVNKNKNPKTRFFGFDTFTGLPENFGVMKKEDYDTKGQFPDVNKDQRCSFVAGLFQDSFYPFLKTHEFKNRKVIHLDADLYTATLYVLTQFYPYLKNGDILIFDEFGVPTHEFKAFYDFETSHYLKYEVLGAVNNYLQIAIKILK
jgi:O-methyltransferase